MLELRDLSFAYGASLPPLFSKLSCVLTQKQWLAIYGPSGVGKSTLAELIAGYRAPSSGSIWLDGRQRNSLPGRDIMLVHQEPDVFPWQKSLETILFAQKEKNPQAAQQLLQQLSLAGTESLYPAALSFGMKKRLSLARALAVKPHLLILDETLSSQDDEVKAITISLIEEQMATTGMSVILITHDRRDAEALNAQILSLARATPTIEQPAPSF